ncbi:hypothetical protein DPMN_059701 [Dreissena polymorpha]|uniref:Uncharacterized protein n=1 Tax=Dreissena polymorpha TaxID=45954 RepID=A0A9D4C3Y7_DREPO|nr:hypothetical protein DPMN_059701 [Dreissena polymorpha]
MFFRGLATTKARWWKITEGLQDVELHLHRSKKLSKTEAPLKQEFPVRRIVNICGDSVTLQFPIIRQHEYVERRETDVK